MALSLLSSFSKQNAQSLKTICGRIMVGLLLLSVSKHNMWLYYGWMVVVVRQLAHYVVVIRLDLSLVSSISKQNMWTYYG